MRNGIWVVGLSATVFSVAALYGLHAPLWTWLIPPVLSLIVASACRRLDGLPSPRSAEDDRRIRHLIGRWSAIEGVLIFAAVNVLANIGRGELLLAAICLIVGLHFFPLAPGMAVGVLYGTAALMTVLGLGGLMQPTVFSWPMVGFGAAVILYATVLTDAIARRAAHRSRRATHR